MFDALLFDFDGTLVDFVDSDIQSLNWLHSLTGSTVSFDDFLETSIDEIMKFHALVAEHKIDPLLMHEFRLRNTFVRHAMAWDDDYVDVYRNKLVATCTPFDGILERLSRLKQKVKTGLISNAYDGEEQRERIRHSSLEACFDVIVIAGDIDIYKPDPSIFLHTLSLIQVAPDRALYVGDSITYDVVGAKSAGMKTALFCKQPRKDTGVADYVITGIDGLRTFLDQVVM